MDILKHNLKPYHNKLKETCENYPIHKLFFFGSVCTEHFKPMSNIDLIIELYPMKTLVLGETILNLWNEFEDLFKRNVDLLTTDQQIRNPILKRNINNTMQLFYGRESVKISV
jgi:predicted nucleotidyltransferase